MSWKERADRKAEFRMRAGWARAYARQNQLLPYAGTSLTAGELERLHQHLEAMARNAGNMRNAASAALLSAVMTTGRSATTLTSLHVAPHTQTPPNKPCLTLGAQWVWWLEPGRPSSEQKFRPGEEPQLAKRPRLIALPCSHRTRQLLEKMSIPPSSGGRLFQMHADDARDILRGEIRRIGVRCSPRMVEDWLFRRMVEMDKGDTAIAALVTGDVPLIAKTVVHYTALQATEAATYLAEALADFDVIDPSTVPDQGLMIGSRYAPTFADVSGLLSQIRSPLAIPRKRRSKPVSAMHNAMTLYTVLFYLIATCARPTRKLLPSLDTIDPLTGYQILNDKPAADNLKVRLIWVSQQCQRQLQLYEAHLQTMRDQHPHLIPPNHDGSPYLITDSGSTRSLDKALFREELHGLGWPYPPNFARHFVRSALLGKISSEVLHAFFGHWHMGTEPWSKTAGLDPLAYRADLEDAIIDLCDRCGLEPQRGL